MYKLIIHVTQNFVTVEAAEAFYTKVKKDLKKHTEAHINGQLVTKFTAHNPTYPEGREVEP